MESSDERSSQKRPRTEQNVEDESIRDNILVQMMMSKNVDDEEDRRKERERKRWQRQERMLRADSRMDGEQRQNEGKKDAERIILPDEIHKSLALANDIKEEPSKDAIMETLDNEKIIEKDDEDDFDMFSSSVSPPKKDAENKNGEIRKTDDFQDAEGYYKATIGEMLEIDSGDERKSKFKVLGVVGKGVFSTVLKCNIEDPGKGEFNGSSVVALKLIRHNETMSRAAETEISILHQLQPHPHIVTLLSGNNSHSNTADASKKKPPRIQHCVGHVVVMFPYLPYNVRDVLGKFGKGVGLSLAAVQSYLSQLLSALAHLSTHNIIHADLKPDNLLVSEDFSTLQMCDFGSAMRSDSAQALPTPYLVSRFYRSPEVILGFLPTPALDLWSIGVTAVELYTGSILFPGANNNDMIHQHLIYSGAPSNKVIRQHLLQVSKLGFPRHFAKTESKHFVYLQQKQQVSNELKNIVQHVGLTQYPTKSLSQLLMKSKSSKESRLKVQNFGNLLQRILSWDPVKRISLSDAQKHDFFAVEGKKGNNR
eukprot:CAMPEP_0178898704 /NCGR_PEP_ID=MMETSP0786-20121207/2489_1 /TAXON_ID=186022 /ORGANISM="Thalassionema frauenfeldii, Strain CCMP 1798" /LENGTH=537 /DNA_ID=CAMNT_0020569473 /DNA_START=112 /DNA_END=1723 /DNA_ORIENTATION=-